MIAPSPPDRAPITEGDAAPAPLAPNGLSRLIQARTRERRLRTMVWVWAAALMLWLLPLGPWSADALPNAFVAVAAVGFVVSGVGLVLLHRRASRLRDAAGYVPSAGQQGWRLFSRWRAACAIAGCLASVTLLVLIEQIDGEAKIHWLAYPLAGIVLAACYGYRGAAAGSLLGLVLALFFEGLTDTGLALSQFTTPDVTLLSLVIAVAGPPLFALVAGWVVMLDDSRRRAEARVRALEARRLLLERDEERFRSLVQNASDLIVVLDADGTRRYVSRSAELLLGLAPETLAGTPFFNAVHPDDGPAVVAWHLATLQGEHTGDRIEFRHRDRTGGWRWLEAVATNLINDPNVGGVVVTAREVTERREMEDALRFLAEAGEALGSSLDEDVTLERLSRLLVPRLGDSCSVFVLDATGSARRVASVNVDPETAEASERLMHRYGQQQVGPRGIGWVLRTGQSSLTNDIGPDEIRRAAVNEEHARLIEGLGVVSRLIVPLNAHGETLGALALWMTRSRRQYTAKDVSVAEDIARRAALAIHNARLYRETRRAREQVRAQLDFTLAITDNLRTGICAVDRAGRVTFVNPAAERMLGWSAADLIGRDLPAVVAFRRADGAPLPPEEYPTRVALDAATPVRNDDLLLVGRDGELTPIASTASPNVIEGEIVGMVLSFSNIAARKRAENALRESEKRFRSLVQNSSDLIAVVNQTGALTYVSPSITPVLGYGSGSWEGKYLTAIMHPEDLARLRSIAGSVLARPGVHPKVEIRLRHADGSWRMFEARGTNLLDDPTIGGIVINLHDITERKRAEEDLGRTERLIRAQKTELEGILTHLSDGLMLGRPDHQVTLANPAARAILGLDATDPALTPLAEAACWQAVGADGLPLDPDRLPLARALAGEQVAVHDLDIVVRGEARVVSVSAAPLRTSDGALHGAVAVLRDVTEARRDQERQEETARLRALGEMASGVAHDFNNLLAVILGRCELLIGMAEASDANWGTGAHLALIKQAALDGAETVKRLQAFSGVRHVAVDMAMDLDAIVRDVIEFTRPRWKDAAQQRGVTIEVESFVEPLPSMQGSPSALREVLVNLIFNSVDAMPHGGTIRIDAYRLDREIRVVVDDSGIGMTDDVRRRIFDPFFSTKGVRGAGLGLSMSYGLITRMGGRIDVRSAPGEGTTFTIAVPYRPAEVTPETTDGGPTLAPLSVLVVDDEAAVLGTTVMMLEKDGHIVTPAGSGMEAMQRMRERYRAGEPQYDLVLTDLGMPEINGLQLISAIRAAGLTMPCLLVTGWGMELSDDVIRHAGAQGVLSKPFAAAELRAAMAAAVAATRDPAAEPADDATARDDEDGDTNAAVDADTSQRRTPAASRRR